MISLVENVVLQGKEVGYDPSAKSACSFRRVESENVLIYNVSVRILDRLVFFFFVFFSLLEKKGQGILYLEITNNIGMCVWHAQPVYLLT